MDFRPSKLDAEVIAKVTKHWETGKAIRCFNNEHRRLSDYAYWYLLSTLWVSYSGWSELELWKRLFGSERPLRETSIMKPSELRAWRELPDQIRTFRAHRPDEKDWIAYTTDPIKCGCFALARGVNSISEYEIAKADALCLFLRRGESEIILIDRAKAKFVRSIEVRQTEGAIK